MLESIGNGTKDGKMAKHVQNGDAKEFQYYVDRWRCSNGLEPLYSREKEKQVVTHG